MIRFQTSTLEEEFYKENYSNCEKILTKIIKLKSRLERGKSKPQTIKKYFGGVNWNEELKLIKTLKELQPIMVYQNISQVTESQSKILKSSLQILMNCSTPLKYVKTKRISISKIICLWLLQDNEKLIQEFKLSKSNLKPHQFNANLKTKICELDPQFKDFFETKTQKNSLNEVEDDMEMDLF